MHGTSVQIHQLKALVAVADHGSISAAARELATSQPGITRALKLLERDVGAALLVRGPSGVVLTPYGEALLVHARQIVDGMRRALEQVTQMVGERSGSLAVASSAVGLALVLPQAVAMMRRQFPDVYLRLEEVVYPTVLDLFRTASIDFAIGPLPAGQLPEDFRCDRLFEVDLVVTVRHGHPLASARSLAELAALDWMIAGPHAGPGAVHVEAFVAAGLQPPRCLMHCDSVGGALQLVEHSEFASFVPRPLAEAAAAAGRVALVPIAERLPTLVLQLFMPTQRILTPAGQALYSAVHSVSRARRPG